MDSTLARGMRKGLLAELNVEIDKAVQRFHKFAGERKLSRSRKGWPEFYRDCEGVLHPFLVGKFYGGTERKPVIGLTLFEPSTNARNSWNEPCLSTTQMMIGYDPWCFKGASGGFNIGEHAIHRMIQRGISNQDVLTGGINSFEILGELKYASLWCGYWSLTCPDRSSRLEREAVYPIIPTPSGLFLCELHRKTLNRVEIRTFVHHSMLSSQQAELRARMLETSEKMSDSSVGVSVGMCVIGRRDWVPDINRMVGDIDPYSDGLDQASMRMPSTP
jgi:hypothetical protein